VPAMGPLIPASQKLDWEAATLGPASPAKWRP
jgi:hypothetical protein